MQLMTKVQEWIHKLESADSLRYLELVVFVLLMAVVTLRYEFHCARNMASPAAMDAAQLGRNLATGHGYTTECIRPLSMHLVMQKNHVAGDKDPARLNENHPDISNPPVYPVVLAGLMKALPFHFDTGLKGNFWSAPDSRFASGRRSLRYQPDFLITFFNQFLFFAVVTLAFFWARRLYDFSVAMTSAIVLLLSDLLWQFSASGLSTMLLLLIFMGLVWCLTLWESEMREPKWGQKGAVLLSLAAGLLVGVGGLTRYSFLCLIIPLVAFLLVFGGPRRWVYCVGALVVVALVVTPWIMRNYAVSGEAFGTASYNVIESFSSGFRLQRSLQPELPPYKVSAYFMKLLANASAILQGDIVKNTGGWITGFFLVGLLVGLRNPALRRLRYFVVGCLAFLVITQALGMTKLSEETPDINSENLIVLISPLVVVFGVGLFYSLLDSIQFPSIWLRYTTVALFVILIQLPIWFSLLLPGKGPIVYPPYWPDKIQECAHELKKNELMMTDIPWAVAWYGDRDAVWLTLNATANQDDPVSWHESFFAINDQLKPIHALCLTRRTMDVRIQSEWYNAEPQSWARFVVETLGRKQVPASFPLTKTPPGYFPEMLVLYDVAR
jgi:hypothetical protein